MSNEIIRKLGEVAENALSYNFWWSTRVPEAMRVRRDRNLMSAKYANPDQFANPTIITEDITRDIGRDYDVHTVIGRRYGIEVDDTEQGRRQYWLEYDLPRILFEANNSLSWRDNEFNRRRDQELRTRLYKRLKGLEAITQ